MLRLLKVITDAISLFKLMKLKNNEDIYLNNFIALILCFLLLNSAYSITVLQNWCNLMPLAQLKWNWLLRLGRPRGTVSRYLTSLITKIV